MPPKNLDLSQQVMDKISNDGIKMRPYWYFVLGSLSLLIAFISLIILSIYSVSVASFSIRSHGPRGEYRLAQMLENFPYWSILLSVAGLGLGLFLFQKYDISYRKNFLVMAVGFVLSIVIAGIAVDYLNIRPRQNLPLGRMINPGSLRR